MSSRPARHRGKQWNYVNIKLCSGTTSKRDRICAKAPIFRHQLTIFFPFFSPFPFFFFCFISVSILLPACAGGKWRERDNSIQKQKWKCRTRRHSVLSWSVGRMHPAAGSQPTKADRAHRLLSRKPPIFPRWHFSCLQMGFADILWFPRTFLCPACLAKWVCFVSCTRATPHARTHIVACLLPNGLICQSQFLQPAISITFKWNPCWP